MKLPSTAPTAVPTAFLTAILTVVLTLVGGVGGVGGGLLAAPASARTARAATYAAPVVGSCHAYTARQAGRRSESSAPVDCATPHTGLTVAVPTLRSLTSKKSVSRGARTCVKAALATVGAALPQTAYDVRYFLPTKAEARQGARWMRCDLVLQQDSALAPVPTPLVSTPLPDTTALCAATIRKRTVATTCSAAHDYRYTAHYRAKGKRYPGEAELVRSVVVACAKLVSSPKRFWAFYPDELDWNAGDRQVSCLSRTRS